MFPQAGAHLLGHLGEQRALEEGTERLTAATVLVTQARCQLGDDVSGIEVQERGVVREEVEEAEERT